MGSLSLGIAYASEQDKCSRGGLVWGFWVPPGGGNSILLSTLLRSSKILEVCVIHLCQEGPSTQPLLCCSKKKDMGCGARGGGLLGLL